MVINAVNGIYTDTALKGKVQKQEVKNTEAIKEENKTIFDSAKEWINDEDKICTDGNDDGKLSLREAAGSFVKGLFGIIKAPIKAVKNAVDTVKDPQKTFGQKALSVVKAAALPLGIAAAAGATVMTGGAILPIMVAAGTAIGVGEVGYGTYKAITADTDGEAKQAFETIGNGVFTTGLSVLTAGKALEAAGKAGVQVAEASSNPVKNVVNCFTAIPDAVKVSKANALTNITGIVQPNSKLLRTNVQETYSKANDVEVYRFNPNGTTEEVLVNNPNISFDADTGKYYVQTSWGEKAYIEPGKEYLIAKYGEGNYNAIAGDIFQETYVDGNAFHANGTRNYLNPTTLEYGKPTLVTKQASAYYVYAPKGTIYQSLEGQATLQPDSVIMIDSQGNPYQNTFANLVKRNNLSVEQLIELEKHGYQP